ncbi:MAG: hypothetical protein MK142_17585 [Pseudomonadales bacterium]|nr:hypothetical protein [Pseudomonadales bacterium]
MGRLAQPLGLLTFMFSAITAGAVDSRLTAAETAVGSGDPLLADIRVNTPEAMFEVLERLDALASSASGFPRRDPVVMVLHGDEALAFTRAEYALYKESVDRAARLEAFGLLDVRICETWMRANGVMRGDLPSFVDTVPDGAVEERRLEAAGYVRF